MSVQIGQTPEARSARGLRERALDVALRCFVDSIGADNGAILTRDPAGTRVISRWAATGREPSISWDVQTVIGRAFAAAGAVLDQDPGSELDCLRSTSAVAAPFQHSIDHRGVVYAAFSKPLEGDGNELARTADSFARLAGLCLAPSPAVAATLSAPSVDALTGCLSYGGLIDVFLDELERSRRHGHRLSCCFVDLDGFKRVNDELGHLEGNRVLSAVGEALRRTARRYDVVARFGGDEFVVLLPETGGRAARAIGSRLLESIREAIAAVTPIPIDASIGIGDWDGRASALELIEAADRNLREAKLAGGGQVIGGTSNDRCDRLVELTESLVRPWRGRRP
jgi:diguanylate cyclase (GGDEF)-like protein